VRYRTADQRGIGHRGARAGSVSLAAEDCSGGPDRPRTDRRSGRGKSGEITQTLLPLCVFEDQWFGTQGYLGTTALDRAIRVLGPGTGARTAMGAGAAPMVRTGPRTHGGALALRAGKHLPRCDFTPHSYASGSDGYWRCCWTYTATTIGAHACEPPLHPSCSVHSLLRGPLSPAVGPLPLNGSPRPSRTLELASRTRAG
jgi:hypothetical protein